MAKRSDLINRRKAESESNLPYSFKYKIRNAFKGRKCPICGCVTSIQHNKPISKGGKHELGNISVICKECNISIKANETGELNAKEVIEVWQMLNG